MNPTDMPYWLQFAQNFGLAAFLLLVMGYFFWKNLIWFRDNVVNPLVQNHLKFLQALQTNNTNQANSIQTIQESIQKQTTSIKTIEENSGRQARTMDKLQETTRENKDIQKEQTNLLRKIAEDHRKG